MNDRQDKLPDVIEPPHVMSVAAWARMRAAVANRSEAHKKLSRALEDCRNKQQK